MADNDTFRYLGGLARESLNLFSVCAIGCVRPGRERAQTCPTWDYLGPSCGPSWAVPAGPGRLFFGSFLGSFLGSFFGSLLVHFWLPKWPPKRTQNRSKTRLFRGLFLDLFFWLLLQLGIVTNQCCKSFRHIFCSIRFGK